MSQQALAREMRRRAKKAGDGKPKATNWAKYLPRAGQECDIEEHVCPIEERLFKYKGIYHKMHAGDISYPLHKITERHFGEDFFEVMKDPEVPREIADPEYRRPLPYAAEERVDSGHSSSPSPRTRLARQ